MELVWPVSIRWDFASGLNVEAIVRLSQKKKATTHVAAFSLVMLLD
jgi:hypothetical protein